MQTITEHFNLFMKGANTELFVPIIKFRS